MEVVSLEVVVVDSGRRKDSCPLVGFILYNRLHPINQTKNIINVAPGPLSQLTNEQLTTVVISNLFSGTSLFKLLFFLISI